MNDILPCPFCGGPAEIIHIDEGENAGGSCVCCTHCLACSDIEFGRKENFVSNWNRRLNSVDREREIIADKAREYADHYPHGSDGRNTFILLAEWIERRITGADHA